MMRRILMLCALLGIAGCASVQTQKEQLAAAKPCCKSASEFKYKAFTDDEIEVPLTAESPAFDFPAGRSFFEAVQLNPSAAGKTLRLKVGAVSAAPGTVLCPSVAFYGPNFEPV